MVSVNDEIVSRFLIFFESLDVTARELETRCVLPQGAVSKARNNGKLSMVSVDKVLASYPRLSRAWMLSGVGSMYDGAAPSPVTPVSASAEVEDDKLYQALYERLLREKDERIAAKDEEIERLREEVERLRSESDNVKRA